MTRPGFVLEVDRSTPPTLFMHGEGFKLERLPVGMREQHNRLLGVVDVCMGEVRLVVEDQRDDVAAGDVGRGDDREFIPGDAVAVADVSNGAA